MTDVRDDILDATSKLLSSSEKAVQRAQVKRLLVYTWALLPPEDRAAFLSKVDHALPCDFMIWEKRWPDLDDPELELAARHWPYIAKLVEGDGQSKDLDFTRSISKLLRFRRTPSQKQITWMKRLYQDWKQWRDVENPNVIELVAAE